MYLIKQVAFSGATMIFFLRGGKIGYVIKKCQHICRGGPGLCSPRKSLNFGSLKCHFLHFEDTFEKNIKVLNHIFNSVSKSVNR